MRKPARSSALSVVALLVAWPVSGHAADRPVLGWQGRTMGTVYVVKLVDPRLPGEETAVLRTRVEARLADINRQMSTYLPESEISRFNRAAAGVPFKVSAEFASVVRFALDLCRRSDGAFDPTLGPLINLWGFGEASGPTARRAVPSREGIDEALGRTGWRHLSVTGRNELVKDIPGLTLNLGGIAKGHGVDEIVKILSSHNLGDAYVAIAGEVRVLGHNARGAKWRLGISAPLDHWREDGPMVTGVSLSNRSLSTSGDYQNFFIDASGRRRSHLIDPRTGEPVRHMTGGISVVAPDSMTADALGTTLFVLGPEAGLKFIDSWENAAALFVIREPDGGFRQFPSARFAAMTAP